jgi:hypothetical protein
LLRSSPRSIRCVSTQRQCVTHCAPREREAQEAGAPACRFAPDRPCEGSTVAAVPCDQPVVRTRSRQPPRRLSTVSVTVLALFPIAAKNDPVTKNLRPPFPTRSQELLLRGIPRLHQGQPSHLFPRSDLWIVVLVSPSRARSLMSLASRSSRFDFSPEGPRSPHVVREARPGGLLL